jgi:hypothetical protein
VAFDLGGARRADLDPLHTGDIRVIDRPRVAVVGRELVAPVAEQLLGMLEIASDDVQVIAAAIRTVVDGEESFGLGGHRSLR